MQNHQEPFYITDITDSFMFLMDECLHRDCQNAQHFF